MKFVIIPKGGILNPPANVVIVEAAGVGREGKAFVFFDDEGERVGFVRADLLDAILPASAVCGSAEGK